MGNELLGRLFAHAGAAGDVVRSVAHQPQHVDDLGGARDAELGHDLLGPHHLEAARVLGAVHAHGAAHELAVVLVGRHHVGVYAPAACFGGQGANDVVGLIARHLEDGDAVGADDVFYNRYGEADGLRRLLALCLVLLVGLVAEGGPGRVEGHADVRGLLLAQHLFEGVDKAQYGRRVEAFRVDAGRLDKSVIRPVDEGVGVQKE